MPNRLSIVLLLPLLPLLLMAGLATSAEQDSATQVVKSFQDQLLSVMQDADKLGFEGRYEQLKPTVMQTHDLQGIASIAVGRTWNDLDNAQKMQLVDTFTQLSIATYASRFDGYSGESFKTVSADATERGHQMVRTVLTKKNGEDVHLDYLLRTKDGRWQIINIVADGVSDLSLKRAEYTRILRKQGFDGLIAAMQDKIKNYRSS